MEKEMGYLEDKNRNLGAIFKLFGPISLWVTGRLRI